jgi:hypothetical protein
LAAVCARWGALVCIQNPLFTTVGVLYTKRGMGGWMGVFPKRLRGARCIVKVG